MCVQCNECLSAGPSVQLYSSAEETTYKSVNCPDDSLYSAVVTSATPMSSYP